MLEEETALDAIPAPAQAAILKRVGGGKLERVEAVTKAGQPAIYEATFTGKSGKKHETAVQADGAKSKP